FCGTWRHGNNPLSLNLNISTGCKGISISANESFLSINGQITAQCRRSEVITFKHLGLESGGDINFCLDWEPLLDQLMLTVGEKKLILCSPASLQDSCCTDLSDGPNTQDADYGILNTEINHDFITDKTRMAYNFLANFTNYSKEDYTYCVSIFLIENLKTRACVSWDTRKANKQQTETNSDEIMPHLLELTVITYLGCAVSLISCVALIIYLFRKRYRCIYSLPIHVGLAVSLAFLSLNFFFNGVLANVGGESVCPWVGAVLHYALLCSFAWMGIEVLHTFWLVYMVFTPRLKPYIWNLVGFALPAVPVVILAPIGDIYGPIEVPPSEDPENPYKMCWMDITENKGWLAFCFTNVMILALLVSSGLVMLFLVYRQIRTRDEWKQNRVAFLSIWGLSCLYGTTWGLAFLEFEPISTFILFITCILNSFQGHLKGKSSAPKISSEATSPNRKLDKNEQLKN
uniref:Adhesion G protein-coupled receptor G1 n=1 Tax=Neolamprologus brichardi TaxID=32507 RepID=A0A3Q4GB17_NEOBR